MFGSGAQTAFGAGSADALTKITGGFAAAFLLICFGLAALKSSTRITHAAAEQLNKELAPVAAPATPGATPPTQGINPPPAPAGKAPGAPAPAQPAAAVGTAPAAKPK